jgi:hypothetical protein
VGSDEDEKKGKSGLLGRWFGGAEPAIAPVDLPPVAVHEADLSPGRDGVALPLAEAPPPLIAAQETPAPKQSWLQRLRLGLSRSSTTIA